MHRLKTIYELIDHNRNIKIHLNQNVITLMTQKRLSNNGTLDTFLHRVRVEMLNTDKHKQDKQDNLTIKERLALRELIYNPRIVINKANKGSTIVVEDRDEYISNAMVHLNNLNVYEPLHIDISPTLKELITEKLKALKYNGLLKQAWFEFCKPPKQTRTSRLYFLKKIHKNPMGIRPIVSSCNSITEPISQFVDRWLQPHVKTSLHI